MKRVLVLGTLALCLGAVNGAFASLIFEGFQTITPPPGGGVGNVPTLLSVQATPTESGCVGLLNGAVTIGSAVCPAGFTGGNEKPGASQNNVQMVSNAMLLNGFTGSLSTFGNLAVVLNANQPGGGSITLNNLAVTLYENGKSFTTSGITGCPATGCVLNTTAQGIGNSGYVFQIDFTQAQAAATALGGFSTSAQVGLAATLSGTKGGFETFFLGAGTPFTSSGSGGIFGGPVPPGPTVPEPASMALLGSGLGLLALVSRRFRRA